MRATLAERATSFRYSKTADSGRLDADKHPRVDARRSSNEV